MRHFQLARRAGVPVVAAALGALVATPALADAKVVAPETAYQGSGQNVTLRVTNDGTAPIHTITVKFRDDTPLAEAYPLSVENWAPSIKMRKINTPLKTLHGGTETTEVAASITWLAMPGKDLPPGSSTDLSVAVGPLPQLSAVQLDVATTLADGKPGPAMPPATMALTPDPTGAYAAAAHAHGGGGATSSGTTASGEEQLFQQAIENADRGSSIWSYAGWVVAALAVAGGAVMMLRNRHRAEDDEPDEEETVEEPAAEEKEPVAAGSSKWAYKG
ncbi:DUF1775 domain-containing protein [Actinoplanes sp. TRM 88003]|uniref:DUF1775 domain-containing protein n=1 Tax=Paractinoplanes aksuensis TaxID=2939490 RepID=A0ABT1DII5_9ACTN|nr:DUF1775 domain-containing protein [Actinoplanes aksuensis]MCO8269916.1 DUF1775 domain-containing protein [Actinoplanes aksuensis]